MTKEEKKTKRKAYYEANKEKIKARVRAYVLNNHETVKQKKRAHHHKNKERLNAISREYRKENKDDIAIKKTIYYLENREFFLEKAKVYKQENKKKRNEYEKNKKKTDIVYKLKCSIRSRLSKSFSRGGFKKDIKTEEMIGCSFEEMRDHLVAQFTDGMTLENYGEWHIDHIIPLASAKTEKELLALAHYTNLQPLWAEDNLIKGSKIL